MRNLDNSSRIKCIKERIKEKKEAENGLENIRSLKKRFVARIRRNKTSRMIRIRFRILRLYSFPYNDSREK